MSRVALVAVILAASACDGGGYRVVVRFDPPELARNVVRVDVALVRDCEEQSRRGGDPVDAVREIAITRSGTVGTIGSVPRGAYGLYARGRDDDCEVRVAGCTPVTLVEGGEGDLVVTVTDEDDGPGCGWFERCDEGECVSFAPDAGVDDAGADDSGARDAGRSDAGPRDAGPGPDGGPTCEDVDCAHLTDGCNAGMCGTDGRCQAVPLPNDTNCDDGDPCTTGDACRAGSCGGTAVDRSAFRLNEVHGGRSDFIEIVNPTGCTLDPAGLELSWRLACGGPTSVSLPSRTVGPLEVLRIIDVATYANELELDELCHYVDEGGWVALCDGACTSDCSTFVDYFEQTGFSEPAGAPACANFAPAPLEAAGADESDSAARVAFTGSGASGRESDWTIASMTRTPP